jgi:large subunit ribosomal protein L21
MISRIDVPVQTSIILDKVLLVGSVDFTVIGQPILPTAKVLATVEEHEKSEKVIIYKKRRRKTYARKSGHRESYTLLRIADIMGAKVAPL